MATDMGNFQKNNEYHLAHNLKKRCIKRQFKGIHDRFLRVHVFRERMIENKRDEDVCRAWDVLAEQDHTHQMSESEYFHYKQNWWISLSKSGNTTEPTRKRSDFNQAFVYIEPFTPRSWRTTTQADALLEVQGMETGIEFFFHLVAMERILVMFLRIPRKSMKEAANKSLRLSRHTWHLQATSATTNSSQDWVNITWQRLPQSFQGTFPSRQPTSQGVVVIDTSSDPSYAQAIMRK